MFLPMLRTTLGRSALGLGAAGPAAFRIAAARCGGVVVSSALSRSFLTTTQVLATTKKPAAGRTAAAKKKKTTTGAKKTTTTKKKTAAAPRKKVRAAKKKVVKKRRVAKKKPVKRPAVYLKDFLPPKRPLTSWQTFMISFFSDLNEFKPFTADGMGAAKSKWAALSQQEKDAYGPTNAVKAAYRESMKKWKAHLTFPQRKRLVKSKKRRIEKHGKRTNNAFVQFVSEEFRNIKFGGPPKSRISHMAELYRAMPEMEKEALRSRARAQHAAEQAKLAKKKEMALRA